MSPEGISPAYEDTVHTSSEILLGENQVHAFELDDLMVAIETIVREDTRTIKWQLPETGNADGDNAELPDSSSIELVNMKETKQMGRSPPR